MDDRSQASLGRVFQFGNRGNVTLSADHDSGLGNDDGSRDYLWGNRDDDTLYRDSSSRKDRLFGGWGDDNKNRDDGLSLVAQPDMPILNENPIATGDRSCRLLHQRPETGARR